MEKKKLIISVFIIVLILTISIIFLEAAKYKDSITASSVKSYKVFFISMDKISQYWSVVNQGASDMADMIGVSYQWDAPQERNVEEQLNYIKAAVNAGADAILIAASDPVKTSSVIEDAKALGVKIIYVDAPAYEEGIVTLATDNYSAGVSAGKTMLDELASEGIQSGNIGIIGVTKENTTTMNRENGFRNAIAENGKYQLLNSKYTEGNADVSTSLATEYMREYPDLVGLFGTNEDTTIGVGDAIKNSNSKIIAIGFDYTDTIHKLLNEGYLKAVMVQNPYTMGYLGMAEAVAALRGFDTGPNYINTGISIKTQYMH